MFLVIASEMTLLTATSRGEWLYTIGVICELEQVMCSIPRAGALHFMLAFKVDCSALLAFALYLRLTGLA